MLTREVGLGSLSMKFLLFLFPLILASCGSSSTPEGEALPVLGSPARAAAWGAPSITKVKNGYMMVYQNPSNNSEMLTIKGSRDLLFGLTYPPDIKGRKLVAGKMMETSTPQVWQKVQITGKDVYLYQSHAPLDGRGSRYKTLGEQLTGPQGIIGNYAVEIEGSNNQMRRWISELRFTRS